MHDCSTCRDSRGLITRACTIRSFPPHPTSEMNGCLRGASNQRPTHATNPPQSVGSIDPRFLRRSRNCLCQEIKAALCFVLEDRSPATNCAAPLPDKLRAYKCSIRRRRLIVCASVCFHPDASRAPASSSRGRDCGRNQLAGNAGLFRLTRFVGRL